MLDKIFFRMNPMQKEAVFHTDGPLLILAGAGSGKTTVLVNRIANLIQFGAAYNSTFIPESLTDDDVLAMERFLNQKVPMPEESKNHLSIRACSCLLYTSTQTVL